MASVHLFISKHMKKTPLQPGPSTRSEETEHKLEEDLNKNWYQSNS